MERESIIIWGASGHAAVVADAIRARGDYALAGFIDDDTAKTGAEFYGGTILGTRHDFAKLIEAGHRRIVFGFGNCNARRDAAPLLSAAALTPTMVVHPTAIVSPTVELGEGAFINAGVVVNARARIGAHAIVNTGAIIDHDCRIAPFAHIAPGVKLAGGVQVGLATWIGLGACVLENRTIGDGAMIGAGAVVLHDVPASAVAFGVPARVRRFQ